MSRRDSDKAFLDTSEYFPEDEWVLLQEWEKVLYRNVMKEIHQALISLGPLIASTVFSLRAKEKEERNLTRNQYTETRNKICQSPSESVGDSDWLSMINEKETIQLNNAQKSEGRQRNDCINAALPLYETNINLRKEEEFVSTAIDLGAEMGNNGGGKPNSGYGVVSICIKEEDESQCMYPQDSKVQGSFSSHIGDGIQKRKRQAGYSVAWSGRNNTNAFSGKIHAKPKLLKSPISGSHSGSMLPFESNLKCEVESNPQTENDVICPTGFILNEGTANGGSSDQYINSESNLLMANPCSYKPNAQGHLRPYACNECDKSFKLKHHLMRHKQTHTGEKPFNCNECEKSFRQKHHLLAHQTSHSGERPYVCLECGKGFSLKHSLIAHQKVHLQSRRNIF